MDIFIISVIILCLAIARIILERAQERSRDQDALLMRLIQYGRR
jgi:hypothetical protein